jgi:hypothetical protein
MTLLDRLDSLFVHLHELNQDTEEVEYYEEDTAQVLCRILEFKEELLLRLLDLLEMIKTKGIKSFTEKQPWQAAPHAALRKGGGLKGHHRLKRAQRGAGRTPAPSGRARPCRGWRGGRRVGCRTTNNLTTTFKKKPSLTTMHPSHLKIRDGREL